MQGESTVWRLAGGREVPLHAHEQSGVHQAAQSKIDGKEHDRLSLRQQMINSSTARAGFCDAGSCKPFELAQLTGLPFAQLDTAVVPMLASASTLAT
jgi:hypothetical protein